MDMVHKTEFEWLAFNPGFEGLFKEGNRPGDIRGPDPDRDETTAARHQSQGFDFAVKGGEMEVLNNFDDLEKY